MRANETENDTELEKGGHIYLSIINSSSSKYDCGVREQAVELEEHTLV